MGGGTAPVRSEGVHEPLCDIVGLQRSAGGHLSLLYTRARVSLGVAPGVRL